MDASGCVSVTEISDSEDDDNGEEEDDRECSRSNKKEHIDTKVCMHVYVGLHVYAYILYASRVYAGGGHLGVMAKLPYFPDWPYNMYITHYYIIVSCQ